MAVEGIATRSDTRLADQGAATGALPAISADLMIQALDAYRGLQVRLDKSMPDQIMDLDGKKFRKKGYWRAVALAFNLTVEPVSERREESGSFKDGRPNTGWVVTYRATHPSGRSQTGDGACFAIEKARRFKCPHPQPGNARRTVHFPHNTCPDFDPDFSWRALPAEATEHNVRSHAHTRAYNRAVSNLVGFGEVSAEEVERDEHGSHEAPADARTVGASSTATTGSGGSAQTHTVQAQGVGQPAATTAPGVTTIDRPVLLKKGKSNKGPWTRYWVHFADGRDGSTFSDTVGGQAQEAQAAGTPVNPELEQGEKGFNLKGWLPVTAPKAEAQEAQHPDEPVEGPEKILTVRKVTTDHGDRWIIQTAKRVLHTDQEAHATQAVDARAAGAGVVPTFEVVQGSKGSINRLKSLAVEVPEAREPGSDG